MNWIPLVNEEGLQEIMDKSHESPQIIFKHSTRCSISSMAKSRLERSIIPDSIPFYMLDLLKYRNLSNKIAKVYGVQHQSPQVLIISKGRCIYEESHSGIDIEDILLQSRAA